MSRNKCSQWLATPSVNPYTGRTIKIDGPTYKKLHVECNRSRSRSRSRSKNHCESWFENPLVNPATGRAIKRDGPTFKLLQRNCGPLPQKRQVPRQNLEKFVRAQDENRSYENALLELKRGKKTGHWIWYIFPQISGLGQSKTSQYYSISSLEEAKEYLRHPILGKRYLECVKALVDINGKTIFEIFSNDDVKVHSSLTLFHFADPSNVLIKLALHKYFYGSLDATTELMVMGG